MKDIGRMIFSMDMELKHVEEFKINFYIGSDGSKYVGEYFEGKKQGKGKYNWADGSYYDGDWLDNRINGYVHDIYTIK